MSLIGIHTMKISTRLAVDSEQASVPTTDIRTVSESSSFCLFILPLHQDRGQKLELSLT
jgi:hypothetical protein